MSEPNLPEPPIVDLWFCTNAACPEVSVYKGAYVAYTEIHCGQCGAVCTKEDPVVRDPRMPGTGRGRFGSKQS